MRWSSRPGQERGCQITGQPNSAVGTCPLCPASARNTFGPEVAMAVRTLAERKVANIAAKVAAVDELLPALERWSAGLGRSAGATSFTAPPRAGNFARTVTWTFCSIFPMATRPRRHGASRRTSAQGLASTAISGPSPCAGRASSATSCRDREACHERRPLVRSRRGRRCGRQALRDVGRPFRGRRLRRGRDRRLQGADGLDARHAVRPHVARIGSGPHPRPARRGGSLRQGLARGPDQARLPRDCWAARDPAAGPDQGGWGRQGASAMSP